ncbi:MAG TPA: hypothetical protein VF939_23675 [Puia sp.]
MITRNNYEEFFLLYVDNELSAADRQIVERFVAENPDLKEEWDLLLQCRIKPDQHLVFTGREYLLKQEGGLTADTVGSEKKKPADTGNTIDAGNYEEYFLSYIDGELDEDARKSVEEFVRRRPSLLAELASLQRTVSVPDPAVVFENKEILYKKERERRIVFFPWRIAAAALVAGVIGLLIFNPFKKEPPERTISSVAPPAPNRSPASPLSPAGKNKPENNEALARIDTPDSNAGSVVKERTADPGTPATPIILLPAVKKNELAVTPRPSSALHLSETGQAAGAKGKEEEEGRALAQTDPPVNTRATDQHPIRITTSNIAVPAAKTLVLMMPAASQNGSPEDGLAMESTPSKKNKLRGLFRKVTRVLDKSTSRDEDDQRSVLIGSFQFALK